ncbi:NUDIX domain-containing protein [Kribbella sp. NPDC056861]|uniref:NUDIX domain-containing protein n=1 Tax=Kribbella sp. NPDC056861 TaxID=3154857 RepID=UPI003437FC6D
MRTRAVAVIVRDNLLLTMHRRKNGAEYYTLPGGGVDEGESIEEACLREIHEETGLTATLGDRLLVLGNEYYFAADAPAGEARLGGEEARLNSPGNQYTLVWLPLEELAATDLKPAAAKEFLLSRAW